MQISFTHQRSLFREYIDFATYIFSGLFTLDKSNNKRSVTRAFVSAQDIIFRHTVMPAVKIWTYSYVQPLNLTNFWTSYIPYVH